MAKNIFLNLAVKDLDKSVEFFTKLGFTFNQQFTDDKATCMIIGENIFSMLMIEDRFKDFTRKELCDAKKQTEVLIAIDTDSREEVDKLVDKAMEAGATQYADPTDYGWMYYRSFADLDGHQWEIMYMDPNGPQEENK